MDTQNNSDHDRKLLAPHFKPALIVTLLAFTTLAASLPCRGQSDATAAAGPAPPEQQATQPQPADQKLMGNISGTVVDQTGAIVPGARVSLLREGQSTSQDTSSEDGGRFSFMNIVPGPFSLAITAPGFAAQTSTGILHAGELYTAPPIALAVAATETDVQVALSAPQVAEAQVKDEEKQRVLRVIPNFYVTYDPHPMALTSREKFELAWKTSIDPFAFAVVGAIAGLQQAQNDFSGYGQGAQGYGKRYGAAYADLVSGTFLGSAILPSLFRQDPRYFYKGTGSRHSRVLYALANAVICKGDNGRWQANYSNVLGNLAAGGISNLYYYPADDRSGMSLTFENGLMGIGATGAANVFQEFFVKKFTRVANPDQAKP
jgi:hypothetical protein